MIKHPLSPRKVFTDLITNTQLILGNTNLLFQLSHKNLLVLQYA